MAVTHAVFTRNGVANLIRGYLHSGKISLITAATVVAAQLTFNATSFAASATGQIVANAIAADTNAVGGVVTRAELRTSTAGVRVLCSVTSTSGGGDIKISNTTISAGQTVSCSSLRYQAAV